MARETTFENIQSSRIGIGSSYRHNGLGTKDPPKFSYTICDNDQDFDEESLQNMTSLTLPRIEEVLKAEGVNSDSIAQQIDTIKHRNSRHGHCNSCTLQRSSTDAGDFRHNQTISALIPNLFSRDKHPTLQRQATTINMLSPNVLNSKDSPRRELSRQNSIRESPIRDFSRQNTDISFLGNRNKDFSRQNNNGNSKPSLNGMSFEKSFLENIHNRTTSGARNLKLPRDRSIDSSVCSSRLTPRNHGDNKTDVQSSSWEQMVVSGDRTPRTITRESTSTSSPDSSCKYTAIRTLKPDMSFLRDMDEYKWLSNKPVERDKVTSTWAHPRILLLPSSIPKVKALYERVVLKSSSLITIVYDFDNASCSSIIDDIKRRLETYRAGSRIRSLMLFCQVGLAPMDPPMPLVLILEVFRQGGPGYFYLLRKKVVTPQKLQKQNNSDIVDFWKSIGSLMCKSKPEVVKVHIMGCYVLGNQQGVQLFDELQRLASPNCVHFENPDDNSEHGREAIAMYLGYERYKRWLGQTMSLEYRSFKR